MMMEDDEDLYLDLETHVFKIPEKTIVTMEDLEQFKKSKAYVDILKFITTLQKSVEAKGKSQVPHVEHLKKLNEILDILSTYVDDIPPLEQANMRFGNKAFRLWLEKIDNNFDSFIGNILTDELMLKCKDEFYEYFIDSFGSSARLDYGTGHELNFLACLYILHKVSFIKLEDFPALISHVFPQYIELMRKVQGIYFLEPAGSHGVWGLDDYQFLPFLFGGSQLKMNAYIEPKSIHEDKILTEGEEEFMYLGCIKHIKSVKKVPFGEGSPMLNDISAVLTWTKVAQGMLKMYIAEVLGKHPVIKHLRFGSVLTFMPEYPLE